MPTRSEHPRARVAAGVAVAALCAFPLLFMPAVRSRGTAAASRATDEAAAKSDTLPPPQRPAAARRRKGDEQQAAAQSSAPRQDDPKDPDYLPFDAERLAGVWNVHNALPPDFHTMPQVPRAPTGEAAMKLAREQGWPDHWRARMRPQHFILGPLEVGTHLVHMCYQHGLIGNARKRPYPLALERWPTQYDDNGQGIIRRSFEMPPRFQMWNRTGDRRLDPREEWRVYDNMHWMSLDFLEEQETLRFPPVERATKNWVMLDSTPFYLMNPGAADQARKDLQGAPNKPVFVVMLRDVLSRAHAHFLVERHPELRGVDSNAVTQEFATVLEAQMEGQASLAVCRALFESPEHVMRDVRRVRHALEVCIYPTGAPESGFAYMPTGFVALGLRYWLHVFGDDASLFRVIDVDDLRGLTPLELMDVLARAFDLRRMRRKCSGPHANAVRCTTWHRHDVGIGACRHEPEWTRTFTDNFNRNVTELAKFHRLSKRWTAQLTRLLAKYDIVRVRPETPVPAPRVATPLLPSE